MTLSVVTVTFNCAGEARRTVAALADQLLAGDELIVVDNGSADETVAEVRDAAPEATVIENGDNLGFAAACNVGAEAASGELLLLLNPDAVPAPGFRAGIVRPLVERRGWGAWMGLVTAEGSRVVNTQGGVVHFTGIAWAGGAGTPTSEAVAEPVEVPFASGACLAIPRRTWMELAGFPPEFFVYDEDVDLSLRLRLRGAGIGVEPAARVDHDYEFEKGSEKWRRLERNRWAVLIRTYPGPLLALLSPALLITEVALVPIALAGGWGRQKLAAWAATIRDLPRLLRERREIQSQRMVGAGEFARWLTPDLDSPYLGGPSRSRVIRAGLRAYWRVVLALLRSPR